MRQPPLCNAFVEKGCEQFTHCTLTTEAWHVIHEMYEVLKATRKVLRHASKVTTEQTRKDKTVQVHTNRALQAQHELKKVEAVLERYDEVYPKNRPTK